MGISVVGLFKAGMLGKRVHKEWVEHQIGRRLFPGWFERRDAKKAAERAEAEAAGGEFLVDDEEGDGMKWLEKIANLRTSTKAGAVGLVPMAVMLLPFADEAEAYIQKACQNDNGALPFLVGGGIVWLTTYITARRSKTPATPGKL